MGVQELLCEDKSISLNMNLCFQAYLSIAVGHCYRQALRSCWAGMHKGHEIQLSVKLKAYHAIWSQDNFTPVRLPNKGTPFSVIE